jgi:glutathione S-transferase
MLSFYYTLRSPYARKVRILLDELDTPHTPVELQPGTMEHGSLFGEEYEQMVPNMRVPSIKDGDQVVFESNFILAYLLQNYPLLGSPKGPPPLATAMVRASHQWQDNMLLASIETLLNSAINLAFLGRFGVKADDVPYLRREQARCQSCLDWLEQRATNEGFMPGVFSICPACFRLLTSILCAHCNGLTNATSCRGVVAADSKQSWRATQIDHP